uniref:Major facilitator superfamily (MFS) profile domain-containing protein n=2 Tax=Acrobeloides nanus TaxID=290746 RepID=A0A914CAM9_9BILA
MVSIRKDERHYTLCPKKDSLFGFGIMTYISYPQRWFVLALVCLLALSNATQWISYSAVHNATNAFYCGITNYTEYIADDCGVVYWTSQIFQIVGVVTGIFGMYITDRFGIRVSCFLGTIFNFAGAVIRWTSSLPIVAVEYRLSILYTGQIVAAISQAFFLCLSPKVAEFWFSEHQRALANSLSFIANPFGVMLAKPPTPPSASSDNDNAPEFFEGLFALFRIPIFYVQMLTFGLAFAIQWSLFIASDPMLGDLGYLKITGYLTTLAGLSGCIGSVVAGFVADRTKWFKEIVKTCYIGIALASIMINLFVRQPKKAGFDTVILVVIVMMLGFFSIPVFPISLELGVETTFPIAEATSSGILIIAGQLLLFLMSFGMEYFSKLDWFYGTKIIMEESRNYQLSIDFWTMISILAAIFTIFTLWPRYHRVEFEENVNIRMNRSNSTRSKTG